MKTGALQERTFAFAVRVVNLYKHLSDSKRKFVLSKQLLRSGTAVGALVRESQQAESKPDFIHKLAIALKEAQETEYWIELLRQTNYLTPAQTSSISVDLNELLRLLISIIKTAKSSR